MIVSNVYHVVRILVPLTAGSGRQIDLPAD